MNVVRVAPDVDGIHRSFDYSVPDEMSGEITVGTSVRVLLHNRRVSGWVLFDHVDPPDGVALRPVLAVRGWGPPPAVVSLAQWAAWRWAGPLARLLRTASAPTLVRRLVRPPAPAPGRPARSVHSPPGAGGELATEALAGGDSVVRLAPAHDPFPIVEEAALRVGSSGGGAGVLVLVPARDDAERLAARLRRGGHPVALLPDQWAAARAGATVAVGTRAAAFAPLPALAAAVVLDADDQAYHEERAPTWRAWEVVAHRARCEDVPCALVSPCPTLDLLAERRLLVGSRGFERSGWPSVEVVDRRGDDPRTGLYSERLVALVRWAAAGPDRRVLCVLNRTGRARLLACTACGEIARCERCGSAMGQSGPDGPSGLVCGRCDAQRPEVCARCSSTRLRVLRAGVSRVRQELEALAGTAVAEVTADSSRQEGDRASGAAVEVGTEAVLHRAGRADAVAFIDFDAELLAPRLRAGEQALALLARAARVVGGAGGPGATSARASGRLLVQTRLPQHPAVLSAVSADPGLLARSEAAVRDELGLPPLRAQAIISGAAAELYGAALARAAGPGVEVKGSGGTWSVLAPDHGALADLLGSVDRPPGRLRVEVDPVRA